MNRYFWVRSDGEVRELQSHEVWPHLSRKHLIVVVSIGRKITEIGFYKKCTIWIRLEQLETILKAIKGDENR